MSRSHARAARGPSQRQLRVGELIRHALAEMLERGALRDPGLSGTPITVTEVRMSPDLRVATAFVMPLGGRQADAALAALDRAAPFLRRELGHAVTLRVLPSLRFALDPSFDEGARIERLLRSPEVARDLAEPTEEDGDG